MENVMSDYLSGMIARSEHAQMNQSRQPVLDFDRRGYVAQPGWFTQRLGALVQWLSNLLPSQKAKVRPEQTFTRDIPSQKEVKSLVGGD
jgi:hypothetical protein